MWFCHLIMVPPFGGILGTHKWVYPQIDSELIREILYLVLRGSTSEYLRINRKILLGKRMYGIPHSV